MPGDLKQRLTAVDVNEVSLVDIPANESPFLVVKRLKKNPKENTPMSNVVKSAEEIKKAKEAEEAAKKAKKPAEGDDAEETTPGEEETEAKRKAADQNQIVALTKSVDEVRGLLVELKKSEEHSVLADTVMERIFKKKTFTGGRVDMLKTATEHMLKLLKEADEDTYKALAAGMATGMEINGPGTAGQEPKVIVSPDREVTPVPTTKSLDGTAKLEKMLETVMGEVEKIKKARGISTDVSTDATAAETEETKKKSFWNGVL